MERLLAGLRGQSRGLVQSTDGNELHLGQRDRLDAELGGGDVLLVELVLGNRLGAAAGLQQAAVKEDDQGGVDGILGPTVIRPAKLLADFGPLLPAAHKIKNRLADRMGV